MTSQFGNPIWKTDSADATADEWNARLHGLQEAYRLITGPSVMSNNPSFQHAIDCCTDLLKRRIEEVQNIIDRSAKSEPQHGQKN